MRRGPPAALSCACRGDKTKPFRRQIRTNRGLESNDQVSLFAHRSRGADRRCHRRHNDNRFGGDQDHRHDDQPGQNDRPGASPIRNPPDHHGEDTGEEVVDREGERNCGAAGVELVGERLEKSI